MSRFGRRWRLVGGGLSDVWRFGDVDLPANSGRLLLRGPNGTGKTTALEALWPYLLDLDASRLAAGKARTTNLTSLMREGAVGKRRYGYAWMTLADPSGALSSFGVRLQYSDGGSPPVRVVPFAVPGRPLHDFPLSLVARAALTADQFEETIVGRGGQIFADEAAYIAHLAARVFETDDVHELALLAQRLRQLRNPSLLGDISAQVAADALRESLPGVSEDTVAATAEALEESRATREAFERDRIAADVLAELADTWSGHAVEVVVAVHRAAVETAAAVRKSHQVVKKATGALERATGAMTEVQASLARLEESIAAKNAELVALEKHEAYKGAQVREELVNRLYAEQARADTATRTMAATARNLAATKRSLRDQLANLAEDLESRVDEVGRADRSLLVASPLLSWRETEQAPATAGGVSADPGPSLAIHGDGQLLRDVAARWESRALEHKRQADAAALALVDYKPVAAALDAASQASDVAKRAAEESDKLAQRARIARDRASESAQTFRGHLVTWCQGHPDLSDDLDSESLAETEPVRLLAIGDEWSSLITTRAEARAAELRAVATQERKTAAAMQTEAATLRASAERLRSGTLLPFPRPAWATAGDDAVAFGSAIDWGETARDPGERALVEAALGAAGVLGATIAADGLNAGTWHIDPNGPVVSPNLGELVDVDAEHPLANVARAILQRIALAPTASAVDPPTAVIIGRDGTFRTGVLFGRVPGAIDPQQLEPASHVGARQRQAAAAARAAQLELQADALERSAAECDGRADVADTDAADVSASGRAFPDRHGLRSAESRRAETEELARASQATAACARSEADARASEAQDLRAGWTARVSALGLPADCIALDRLQQQGNSICERVRSSANVLRDKLANRLQRILETYARIEASNELDSAVGEAIVAVRTAADTRTRLAVIDETMGSEIKDILRRHDEATSERDALKKDLEPARTKHTNAVAEEARARTQLNNATTELDNAIPVADEALLALRRLLEVAGVADAAIGGGPLPENDQLLTSVQAKLEGRKTRTKKTVRELADQARARLAGAWAIDPGEDHGELLTWVLTHRDVTYSLPQGAAHAHRMRERAERALLASEERALREFVIGRLPSAIGTAWTKLHDWIRDVNRKMRSASASSGVGVQVQIPVLSDLTEHERVVYEFSCKVSNAARTRDQERELESALQAVILSAQGDSMRERVDRATDIRKWLDVHYEVTRAGGKTQRWGTRTGLSTGERRLVVLAPMLAAIAAQYERFGERALRLVALDEVPVEVDERGRDGLARYIAQLDLDLICTSHQWDGCPGAWDGIDAHELETGPDQTVVAFPMIVRGEGPLPGDPAWRVE